MTEPQQPQRRTFLKVLTVLLGGLFSAVLGAPVLAYFFDSRNRPSPQKGFRTVDGVLLNELMLGKPVQGVIRDVRTDAWTLHPNDVIGRVWVIKTGSNLMDIDVFTTVCPHLGCSINHTGSDFRCPCHQAEFKLDGSRVTRPGYNNVAPRPMDSLNKKQDEKNPNVLLVEYENYYQLLPTKTAKA